jgi:hypothetical protein
LRPTIQIELTYAPLRHAPVLLPLSSFVAEAYGRPRVPRTQTAISEQCCCAQSSNLIGGRPSSAATVSVVTAL